MKLRCMNIRCGWCGPDTEMLKAQNPFQDGDTLNGCPLCRDVNTLQVACDEPDCWEASSCGTPTDAGYRRTCGKHMPRAAGKKKKSAEAHIRQVHGVRVEQYEQLASELRTANETLAARPSLGTTDRDAMQIKEAAALIESSGAFMVKEIDAGRDSTLMFSVAHKLRHALRDLYCIVTTTPPSPLAAPTQNWREVLEELADLMDDVRSGNYAPDSFTTQPARELLTEAARSHIAPMPPRA